MYSYVSKVTSHFPKNRSISLLPVPRLRLWEVPGWSVGSSSIQSWQFVFDVVLCRILENSQKTGVPHNSHGKPYGGSTPQPLERILHKSRWTCTSRWTSRLEKRSTPAPQEGDTIWESTLRSLSAHLCIVLFAFKTNSPVTQAGLKLNSLYNQGWPWSVLF